MAVGTLGISARLPGGEADANPATSGTEGHFLLRLWGFVPRGRAMDPFPFGVGKCARPGRTRWSLQIFHEIISILHSL